MYKEPSWYKPFRRNKLNLAKISDGEIQKLANETRLIVDQNEETYGQLNGKAKQMYSIAIEIYGLRSDVTGYLRKHPVEAPLDYSREWHKFLTKVTEARERERVLEKRRIAQRASYAKRKQEKAELEREENNSVGPQGLTF